MIIERRSPHIAAALRAFTWRIMRVWEAMRLFT